MANVDSASGTRTSARNIPDGGVARLCGRRREVAENLLYPRDPSLDPQLVWKGKDEQDRRTLDVPAVPIYIQEKIHPQAIIEDLREREEGRQAAAAICSPTSTALTTSRRRWISTTTTSTGRTG